MIRPLFFNAEAFYRKLSKVVMNLNNMWPLSHEEAKMAQNWAQIWTQIHQSDLLYEGQLLVTLHWLRCFSKNRPPIVDTVDIVEFSFSLQQHSNSAGYKNLDVSKASQYSCVTLIVGNENWRLMCWRDNCLVCCQNFQRLMSFSSPWNFLLCWGSLALWWDGS